MRGVGYTKGYNIRPPTYSLQISQVPGLLLRRDGACCFCARDQSSARHTLFFFFSAILEHADDERRGPVADREGTPTARRQDLSNGKIRQILSWAASTFLLNYYGSAGREPLQGCPRARP